MLITVPVYVESRKGDEGEPALFHVRPLLAQAPRHADGELDRALQKVTQDLRALLHDVGRGIRHELLALWAWNPTVQEHRCDLWIELKSRVVRGRYLLVTIEALGRKLVFCPNLDGVWFEVGRGQALVDRANRVFTEYFRKQEREAFDETSVRPEDYALTGTAWVTTLDVEIRIEQSLPAIDKVLKALLGGQDVSDGPSELSRCGCCLNWLSPLELSPAIGREREVGELERRLTASERRPVLLLGQRLSGKTAVVQEYVSQITRRRKHAAATKQNVWHLAPQRLIAGMSFVGQWESRLLAILRYARKKDLVLYFDDFLGLFQAGQSRDSSLNMATVLKPYLERRDCRILAEMTPEAWRVLRERDRGLADLFDVLPIAPATRDETARIAMGVRRQLEQQQHCMFRIDGLTTVLDLQERYAPETAFPGKAVAKLRELAAQYGWSVIGRDQVLESFQAAHGLSSRFFDPRRTVTREEIVAALQSEVVGQEVAVAAVADVLTTAKAQLSDPRRPLGSLLFIGPTGVGKTQLAKATARFLFGNAERLIRFDLNQFVHAGSAARLVGTFGQPDGLLTGAVRRSPFGVLLLDEIEKAHPEVFNLLLQVLGEGRLTDALGRTVSFTNTLIIMTSNLGVREAEKQLGFLGDAPLGDHVWLKTIERFFRPEFFNRIDRIVPFQRLSPAIVRDVALLALDEVLKRDGFSRRQSFVVVEPRALDQLVSEGYSPIWGARGLKRTLERQLVQPLARSLAGMSPQAVTRLQVYPAADGVKVQLDELREAAAPAGSLCHGSCVHGLELVEAVKSWLATIAGEIEEYRPLGPISAANLSAEHQAYFLLQERLRKIEDCCSELRDTLQQNAPSHVARPIPSSAAKKMLMRTFRTPAQNPWLREAIAEEQFRSMLDAMASDAPPPGSAEMLEQRLLRLVALLHAEWRSLVEQAPDRAAIFLSPQLRPDRAADRRFAGTYFAVWQPANPHADIDWGLDVTWNGRDTDDGPFAVELQGLTAATFAASETGLHLEALPQRALRAWTFTGASLQPGQTLADAWTAQVQARESWLDDLTRQGAPTETDPWRTTDVLRLFEASGAVLDFRTSEIEPGGNVIAFLRNVILDVLPLPKTLQTKKGEQDKAQL